MLLLFALGTTACQAQPRSQASLHPISATVLEVELRSPAESPPAEELLEVVVDGRPWTGRQGVRRRVREVTRAGQATLTTWIFFEGQLPLSEGQKLSLRGPQWSLQAQFHEKRPARAVHVNLLGYPAAGSKRAWVGADLGSLGQLSVNPQANCQLLDQKGQTVWRGPLQPGTDRGWPWPSPYSQLYSVDFSAFQTPGNYRLEVEGMGQTPEFRIGPEPALDLLRTLALGLYHQRCGASNQLPYTRFLHQPCHTRPADVPQAQDQIYLRLLLQTTGLKNLAELHFPWLGNKPVDLSGGHHDAGDYSKYVINSARLVHSLLVAVDYFPEAARLDQLGLPESGDGVSDLLQEALREADFLSRMQDQDGGFSFMVYPQTRRYEDNVLPDHGDAQFIYPKNTAATAACVAALAQCARSPALRKLDPARAGRYLKQARSGWDFLEQAWQTYGESKAYQKITHYGDRFQDRDECVWAAAELLLASDDAKYADYLHGHFRPQDPATRFWGWMRLCEGYGCALRSLALAKPPALLGADYHQAVQAEVLGWADDLTQASQGCAYGLALPFPSKRAVRAGWFFATDQAFDLLMAQRLEYSSQREQALQSQVDYLLGANANDVEYLTGLPASPRHIVNQFARNDQRQLPPGGLLVGCIQEGNPERRWSELSLPPDNQTAAGYPLLQRFCDGFYLPSEATVDNQGRALALAAALSPAAPAWHPQELPVTRGATGDWSVPPARVAGASLSWEVPGEIGEGLRFHPRSPDFSWLEVEAHWPDGRRAYGRWNANDNRDPVEKPPP